MCRPHILALFAVCFFVAACAHTRKGYKTQNRNSLNGVCPESENPLQDLDEQSRCGQELFRLTGQAACDADNANGCLLASSFTLKLRGENALQNPDQFDADTQDALNYAERGCALGNQYSCLSENAISMSTASTQRERILEFQQMDRRCTEGMAVMCSVLGYVAAESSGGEERAAEYQERACELGLVASCHQYALYVEQGFGVEPSMSKSRKLHREACDKGSIASCEAVDAAKPVVTNDWVFSDIKISSDEYLEAASLACDNGFRHACTHAGVLVDRGEVTVEADPSMSFSLYDRGCEQNAPWSCLLLAEKQSSGTGTVADTPLAAATAQKACDGGVELGCDYALELTAETLDLTQTEARESACAAGDGDACYVAGLARQHGANFEVSATKAVANWEKGCELGSENSCFAAGQTFNDPDDSPDFGRANQFFSDGCDNGHAKSCTVFGANLVLGRGVPEPQYEEAMKLVEAGCNGGHALACGMLGDYYLHGEYVERDVEKAEKLFRAGCYGDSTTACYRLASLIENAGEEGFRRAVTLYEYSCSREISGACNRLGILFSKTGEQSDLDTSRDYFERSCMLEDVHGCINLAEQQLTGKGVEQDVEKAVALLEQNCDEDNAACIRLGDIYRDAHEVDRDPRKAAGYYGGVCEDEDSKGCERLAWMHLHDAGVEYAPGKALDLYDQACELGSTSSCRAAYDYFVEGHHVETDPKRAYSLLDKACVADDLSSCDQVADHLFAGIGAAPDPARARKLADRVYDSALERCDLGNTSSCRFVAHLMAHRLGSGSTDWSGARKYLDKACDTGKDWACHERAEQLSTGEIYEQDREKGLEILRRLCTEREQPAACFDLAFYGRFANDDDLRIEESFSTFERLCEDGMTKACTQAGQMQLWGIGTDTDVKAAIELMSKACTEDNSFGCPAYDTAVTEHQRTDRADEVFERAEDDCAQGLHAGCQSLVGFHAAGIGTAVDPKKAAETQKRWCLLTGNGLVCGTSASLAARPELLSSGSESTCTDADPSGCVEAGLAAEFGVVPFGDGGGYRVASAHYERACKAGDKEGCRLRFAMENWWKAPLIGSENYETAQGGCTSDEPHFCEAAGFALSNHNWKESLKHFRTACAAGRQHSCLWLVSNGEPLSK